MGKYLKFSFPHVSLADYDQLIRLEEVLAAELPGACLVDGHDFGCGKMALFIRAKGRSDPSELILDLIQSHSDLECLDYDVREDRTWKSRWRSGDILMAVLLNGKRVFGRFLAHDPGPFMLVYDSMGLDSTDFSEIIESQIIVRATALHRDIAATGEWTVVGNIPLTKEEADLVKDAPGVIAGENNQLIAANIYYDLCDETAIHATDIDTYLNSDNHPIPATFYFGQHPFPSRIEMLLMRHKDNVYFLDEIWCDAEDWAKGLRLDEAERILTEGAS